MSAPALPIRERPCGFWQRALRPLTRQLKGKSRGQALIYLSIVIVVLFGFAALVADGGLIWLNKRAMQNAVDSSALAAAQELPLTTKKFSTDLKRAGDKACQYTEVKTDSGDIFNRVSGMQVNNCADSSYKTATDADSCKTASESFGIVVCGTSVPYDSVRVRGYKQYQPIFGRLLQLLPIGIGDPTITINVSATAMVGSLKALCVFPIFQAEDLLVSAGIWKPDGFGNYVEYNTGTVMKTSADNISGNFLALQVDGSNSKNDWRDTVASAAGCKATTYETVTTNTGNFEGPFNQAFDPLSGRQSLWSNSSLPGYCPTQTPSFNEAGLGVHPAGHPLAGQQVTPENCYRVVKFPLVEGNASELNGSKTVTIRGFLTFYISNWCGNKSTPPQGSGSSSQTCAADGGTGQPEISSGELWGYYLRYEAVSDLPIKGYDGLGTEVVALID